VALMVDASGPEMCGGTSDSVSRTIREKKRQEPSATTAGSQGRDTPVYWQAVTVQPTRESMSLAHVYTCMVHMHRTIVALLLTGLHR